MYLMFNSIRCADLALCLKWGNAVAVQLLEGATNEALEYTNVVWADTMDPVSLVVVMG